MRIIESVCAECGAKDSLYPLSGEEDPMRWKCTECEAVFVEE